MVIWRIKNHRLTFACVNLIQKFRGLETVRIYSAQVLLTDMNSFHIIPSTPSSCCCSSESRFSKSRYIEDNRRRLENIFSGYKESLEETCWGVSGHNHAYCDTDIARRKKKFVIRNCIQIIVTNHEELDETRWQIPSLLIRKHSFVWSAVERRCKLTIIYPHLALQHRPKLLHQILRWVETRY